MADAQRVEIGFEGGQVVSARLAEDDLKDLRKQLEKVLARRSPGRRGGRRSPGRLRSNLDWLCICPISALPRVRRSRSVRRRWSGGEGRRRGSRGCRRAAHVDQLDPGGG